MMNIEPKVGDECKADFEEEGKFEYGTITKIEDGLAYTDINMSMGSRFEAFVGNTPTHKVDGVWVFDAF